MNKPVITVIGGGGGVSKLLFELKNYPVSLNAIISMADSGGSTGQLREQYGVSALGDIRKSIVALATKNIPLANSLNKRYDDGDFRGHTVGNLMLADMELKSGSLEYTIRQMCKTLGITHNIIPVTLGKPTLCAQRYDGTQLVGESEIDNYVSPNMSPIKSISLTPNCEITPSAKVAIESSNIIVIGPGDFYTSIIPNFLVNGVSNEISKSNAKKIYVGAFVTKHNETDKFSSTDFIENLEIYLGSNNLEYALFNTRIASQHVRDLYLQKKSTQVKIIPTVANQKPYVIAEDFLDDLESFPMNGAKKLSKRIYELLFL